MSAFFEGHDGKEGSFAAIHGHKTMCYKLAKATSGRFQAIEEMEGKSLMLFAFRWDRSATGAERRDAIESLLRECFHVKEAKTGDDMDVQANAISAELGVIAPKLAAGNGAEAATAFLSVSRKHPRWKLYRSGLWRDAERAVLDLASGRSTSMEEAAAKIRHRATHTGRSLPPRTVSTPLLLKGLEFDHVVVPDAGYFVTQKEAQAKLFYVAISRATRTLTVTSQAPILRFPMPRL
jgi:DNA helicase-2/ATP-dependent DNA helicase PcrA